MKKNDFFWKKIEEHILSTHPNITFKDWTSSEIESFREKMASELFEICSNNSNKARLCGITVNKRGELDRTWEVIVYKNILQIFRYKKPNGERESYGQPKTRNQFAIYFGYESEKDEKLIEAINQIKKDVTENPYSKLFKFIQQQNISKLNHISSFYRSYKINEIYIKPTLLSKETNKIILPDLQAILGKHDRAIIHSDSFTGKSTLLKYLALNFETEAIMLYLPMANYNGDLVNLVIENYQLSLKEAKVLLFQNEHTIILLDAFDEIRNEKLQSQLLEEYLDPKQDRIYRFILTSRSKYLTDRLLPTTNLIEIQDYHFNNIYLLIDKILVNTSQVFQFHSALKNATITEGELKLLKFPWLVIFQIEHFKENKSLNNFFFLTLPIEIFHQLQEKMVKRGYKKEQVLRLSASIGELLYRRTSDFAGELQFIFSSELKNEEIDFLDELVNFGALNVFSLLGQNARKFKFTIPVIQDAFIAFYLSILEEPDLKSELKNIYFNALYTRIIKYAASFRALSANNLELFLNGKQYLPRGVKTNNKFERLFPFLILPYLPNGAFRLGRNTSKKRLLNLFPSTPKTPYDFTIKLFEIIQQFVKENAKSARLKKAITTRKAKVLFNNTILEAWEEKLFDVLYLIIEKDDQLAETFLNYYKTLEINNLDPMYKAKLKKIVTQCINTPTFKSDFIRNFKDKKRELYWTFHTLNHSPVFSKELTQFIWQSIEPKIFRLNFKSKSSKALIKTSFWENRSTQFMTILFLLKKADLSNESISKLLKLLTKHTTSLNDDEVAISHLGDFKSVRLGQHLAQFFLEQLKKGGEFDSFDSPFYFLPQFILLEEDSSQLIKSLNKIIDIIIIEIDNLGSEKHEKRVLNENLSSLIRGLYANFLALRKFRPIKERSEMLFLKLLDLRAQNITVRKQSYAYLFAYLISLESEVFLNQIQTNQFFRDYLLVKLRVSISNNSIWQNLSLSLSYLELLYDTYQNLPENQDLDSQTEMDYIMEILYDILATKNQQQYQLESKIDEHLRKFEEDDDFYELSLALKFREFGDYLQNNNKDARIIPYAIAHAIYNEKPIFISKGQGKIYYSFKRE